MTKDHDLWFGVFRKLDTMYAFGLQVTAAKITSRQVAKLYADVVERWVIAGAGNDAADRAASLQYLFLPPHVLAVHEMYTQKIKHLVHSGCPFFNACVSVGQRVVAEKDAAKLRDDDQWQTHRPMMPTTELLSFEQLPEREVGEFLPHNLADLAVTIFDWLKNVVEQY